MSLTTEVRWLAYTALLAGSLWMPFVVGANITDFPGKREQFVRPPDHQKMAAWVHRSFRAHANLLEQFLPFAVIVLVGAGGGVSNGITRFCAVAFFWVRLLHAIGFITGMARLPLRPMLYFSGWLLTLTYAWQVLQAT